MHFNINRRTLKINKKLIQLSTAEKQEVARPTYVFMIIIKKHLRLNNNIISIEELEYK